VVRRSMSGVIAQPSWPVPATIQSAWAEVSEREVEFEILRHDKEALESDVTRCRFAEFFAHWATRTRLAVDMRDGFRHRVGRRRRTVPATNISARVATSDDSHPSSSTSSAEQADV
jgi:hypothetical protein